jgi:hypothetical protein
VFFRWFLKAVGWDLLLFFYIVVTVEPIDEIHILQLGSIIRKRLD